VKGVSIIATMTQRSAGMGSGLRVCYSLMYMCSMNIVDRLASAMYKIQVERCGKALARDKYDDFLSRAALLSPCHFARGVRKNE